jgi:hypothetical protein
MIQMNKIVLLLLSMFYLPVYAQVNGSGYYRVQSKKSSRFLTIVDNRASVNWTNTTVDLYAFRTIGTFEDNVCWNPATICYLTETSKANYYNISGQGLDLYNVAQTYMNLQRQSDGSYILKGEVTKSGTTIAKTLYDSAKDKNPANIDTKGTDGYQYWYIRPVKGNYYFGIKPDFQATMENKDSYYTTMYASFPFNLGSDMKAYYVTEIKDGYVRVVSLGNAVPGTAPVIVECASDKPSENKVELDHQNSANPLANNKLKGVYYCNDVTDADHRNVTEYKPASMRVLGRAADGRLAFITDRNLKYIPANKAYLTVPTGTPETLYVVTEIPAGIETVTNIIPTSYQRGVYSLSGQRLGDTTEGMPKGVYIVNGRKTVLK